MSHEMAIVGVALQRPELLPHLKSRVTPGMLHGQARELFVGLCGLLKEGKPITPQSVGSLGANPDYVFQCMGESAATDETTVDYYIRTVEDYARRSLLFESCVKTNNDLEAGEPVMEVADALQSKLATVAADRGEIQRSLKEVMLSEWDSHVTFTSSGYERLDARIGGYPAGYLSVVGGKTGMGKTGFAASSAVYMAQAGKRVAFAAYEMSAIDIAQTRMQFPAGGESGLYEIAERIYIDDPLAVGGDRMVESLCLRMLALHSRWKFDALFVDYIQKLTRRRYETHRLMIGDVCRELEGLAKRLAIPVIAMSQLSRESAAEPDLNDLKESGDIENCAALVMFPVRPSYDKIGTSDGVEECKLLIPKNRFGSGGMTTVWFEGDKDMGTRFY